MKFNPKALPFASKALFTIVGGAVMINPAFAQDQSEEVDEVVVTGLRSSLIQSMEIKRDAIGVVDAITAEDIGKFPDTNLAESLQRIPGVSIDRQNGEGGQVTVRGFGPAYNLVTLNGRTVPTAEVNLYGTQSNYNGGQGRSFDFSNIAAEAVSALEVYKTGQALLPSGGIGATINVKTRRPLDKPGMQASFGIKAMNDTSNEAGNDITPQASGQFSWTNEAESFGVGLFAEYSKRDSGATMGQTNDWVIREANNVAGNTGIVSGTANPANFINLPADGELFAIPQDSRYDVADLTSERMNTQAVLQFRPMESLTLTVDYTMFETKQTELRYEQTNWFNTPFNQLTFKDDGPGFSHAVFMQENNNGTKDMGFEQTNRAQKDEFDSLGFNAEWAVSDSGTLRFDYHTDTAKSSPNNPLGHSATFVAIAAPIIASHQVSWANGDGFPVQSYTFSDTAKGNNNGVIDVGDLGTQVQRSSTQYQEMDVDEFDLRYTIKSEKSSLTFGGNLRKTEVGVAAVTTQQDLGSWGVGNPRDVEALAPGVMEAFCMSCRFNDYPVGQANIAFRGDATDLFTAFQPAFPNNPITVNASADAVQEDISALYVQFGTESEFLGKEVQITGGLRYETTEVDSVSAQGVPSQIRWTADNDFVIDFSGTSQGVTGSGRYNHLLPNIDIKYQVADKVVTRVSYSETIGRVPYGSLFASTSAGAPNNPTVLGGQTGGTQQNPGLLPLESKNFDVSAEWYYKDDSYVSLGFFDKTVKNFLGTGVFTRPLFGLLDPTSGLAGTRSGDALAVIDDVGVDRSPANLFTLVALIDANNGNVAAAQATFEANLVNGALPQSYIDSILAQYDVVGIPGEDPEMQFRVSQPVNTDEGNINGFELAVQHFFGETGFGAAASYTKVNGDVNGDPLQDPDENQFALVGLSDSANVTLMYEKYGISARLAYNWRDTFLSGTNQGGSRSPQFTDSYGQFDLSVSYDINENLQVQFEGINLTGEDLRQYRRFEGMTIWAYELAPRYAVGARYKF